MDVNFITVFLNFFLKDNDIEMYSTHNEGKSAAMERSIRTLKNNIYKQMITVGKNVYFNVLDDIVDKYNIIYHRSIKMKPKDINDSVFVEYNEELIKKIINLKYLIISEFQSIKMFFPRFIHRSGVKKFLLLKK